MNLSMKWLSDYVDIDVTPREFSEAMTMSGSKVEGYEIEGSEISKVVTGKVLSIEKHPDADKLVVCQMDVGREDSIQIVTGATNLFVGAVVPVCLDGATLPGGKKIKKGKLRGVVSEGMMCSLGELGLTVNDFPGTVEDGIFILQEPCGLGLDIREVLGLNDTCVEFEITSNRPDCLSVVGLAREAAATFHVPLKLKEPVVKGSGGDIHDELKVEVQNTDLCFRYVAKLVKNVTIKPSPRWMRERLRASGVRPINNLVDITNYVMLEYGQPMHAFDLRYVAGNSICVRSAKNGEKITTLEGVEHELTDRMLVIADAEKPIAVAGVMGGEYSGIMDDTATVVFESASFQGSSVRTTAKALGIRTESSARFEKGLDPRNCYEAILRACELVELLGAGEVVDGIIDEAHFDAEPKRVKLEPEWTNRFLGINVTRDYMVEVLESLSFQVEGDDIIVPSFRIDIEHKADIAEEIARIYGYNNIPTTVIRGVAEASLTPEQKFETAIGNTMLALGCSEVATYSFISPKYYDKLGLPQDSALRRSVTISNPLGEDTSVMRTTTLPSILEVLSRNYNNRNPKAWMYEIGKVYLPKGEEELPDENNKLTIGLYGGNADFYTLKGMVETLLDRLNVTGWDIAVSPDVIPFHSGRCATISKDGVELGVLGEVHPVTLETYGIGTKAYLACFDFAALYEGQSEEKSYHPLPKFPASNRDLSVVCDEDLPVIEIEKTIRQSVGKILEQVEFFDIFRGDQIGKHKKSVSYSIVLRAQDRTLNDEEADNAIKKVLKNLEKIGVTLR